MLSLRPIFKRNIPVVETGLDTAERDRGGEGNDNVDGGRAHGADVKSNVQYLACRDKVY